LLSFSVQAQNDSLYVKRNNQLPGQKPSIFERITVGGNFGLALGNPLQINLSPLIGYRFTDKFVAGAGPSFIYTRIKAYGLKIENSVLGGRTFAQYTLFQNFAARGEYEYLSIQYPVFNGTDYTKQRQWVSNPMLGGSYVVPIGRKASFGITALYNFNYKNSLNQQYLYGSSPFVIRAGIML
jgi:hypothetical protein